MLVNFYNNKSANNVVHKNIESVTEPQNCQIWDDVSIQQPVLLVDYFSNFDKCNYCYIEQFHRYYYIVDVTIYDGNKLKLSLASDVLMSFWSDIKKSQCQAKRSTNKGNYMLEDNMKTYSAKPKYQYLDIGTFDFTPDANGTYVVTIGGK